MSAPVANMSVWVGEDAVCIKITGRASLHSCVEFKNLVVRLVCRGRSRFVLDLGDCVLMDSTFLGVLAHLGKDGSEAKPGEAACRIELLNPNQRVTDLLENVGIAEMFKIHHGPCEYSQNLTPVAPSPDSKNQMELARTSLQAHQTLMQLNPDNIPKFKDVTRFLEEDLQRLEQEAEGTAPQPDDRGQPPKG